MKKLNKKGFVLLETLLVSTFIITILVYLYVQFVNLKNGYESSFNYDSVPNIYSLKQADGFINKEYGYGDLKEDLSKSTSHYIELFNNSCDLQYFSNNYSYCNKLMNDLNIKTLLMLDNRIDTIKENFSEHNPYTNGLFNYLKKIDPVLASQSYLLVAEFKDNSYAYLKLDDVNVVVTFDANGGTVGTQTKNVTPGQTYGTLPIPTKSGYTFKGWNGKNMFNEKDVVEDAYVQFHDGTPINWDDGVNKWNYSNYILIEGGKTYTFNPNSTPGNQYTAHAVYDQNKNFIIGFHTGMQVMEMPSNAKYIRVSYRRSNSSNVQLEESSEATEYEPYYIQSNTKVVQSTDHTLTAIWEANS